MTSLPSNKDFLKNLNKVICTEYGILFQERKYHKIGYTFQIHFYALKSMEQHILEYHNEYKEISRNLYIKQVLNLQLRFTHYLWHLF